MPRTDGKMRLGLDVGHGPGGGELIPWLQNQDIVEDVRPGGQSTYLTSVLGACQWREVFNAAPFELLADHVTEGTGLIVVSRITQIPRRSRMLRPVMTYQVVS